MAQIVLRSSSSHRSLSLSHSSDSAAMASGPPDVMANQEPAEVVEECSGNKSDSSGVHRVCYGLVYIMVN